MTRKIVSIVTAMFMLTLMLSACNPSPENEGEAGTGNTGAADPSMEETAPEGHSATVSEVEGGVLGRLVKAEEFQAIDDGYVLYTNGQIMTESDGRARLDFSDETIVRIGPDTVFTLQAIEEESGGFLKRLFMEAGKLWVILKGGTLEIETDSGVAAVLGSYLMLERDSITGVLYGVCLEGICGFETNAGYVECHTGETVMIKSMDVLPEVGLVTMDDIQDFLNAHPDTEVILPLLFSTIGDLVWNDANENGIQDEGEGGMADVAVTLYDTGDHLIAETVTDVEGYYQFEEILAGEYYLVFTMPEEYHFTLQDQGADDAADSDANEAGITDTIVLLPGEHRDDLDAGLVAIPKVLCPLTGLPVEDPSKLTLRPIFVSISMFPASVTRKNSYLNYTPVVFETVIDAGQTRLQALFYCDYPSVGDAGEDGGDLTWDISGARSARIFYAELAQIFGAGLVYLGVSPEVASELSPFTCAFATPSDPRDIGSGGLDVERLLAIAEDCQGWRGNTDLNIWQFGPPPDMDGEAVVNLLMHYNFYNQTRWIFDPEEGGYVRYQNTPEEPNVFTLSIDQGTGEPVVRQNILILETPHMVLNRAGTIINFDLTDYGGYAFLLRDGMKYRICWSTESKYYAEKSERYRPFVLMNCETKEPINLAPGRMWVNVVDPYNVGYAWKVIEGVDFWRVWHNQPVYTAP